MKKFPNGKRRRRVVRTDEYDETIKDQFEKASKPESFSKASEGTLDSPIHQDGCCTTEL